MCIVSGYTYSTNFPTQNALQSTLAGGSDIFITKFTPGSSALLFSTYLGGSSIDESSGDGRGFRRKYLPDRRHAVPQFPGDGQRLSVHASWAPTMRLSPRLLPAPPPWFFPRFSGAARLTRPTALALDSAGNIYITGFTQSSNFPLLDPFQNVLGIAGAGNLRVNKPG